MLFDEHESNFAIDPKFYSPFVGNYQTIKDKYQRFFHYLYGSKTSTFTETNLRREDFAILSGNETNLSGIFLDPPNSEPIYKHKYKDEHNKEIVVEIRLPAYPVFLIVDVLKGVVHMQDLTLGGAGKFNEPPTSGNMTVRCTGIHFLGAPAYVRNCSFINLHAGIINDLNPAPSSSSGTGSYTIELCSFHRFHYGFLAKSNAYCTNINIINNLFLTGHYCMYGEATESDFFVEDTSAPNAEHSNWNITGNTFELAYCGISMRTQCAEISGNWFERLGYIEDGKPLKGGPCVSGGKPITPFPGAWYWRGISNTCASTAMGLDLRGGTCSTDEYTDEVNCRLNPDKPGNWIESHNIHDIKVEFFQGSRRLAGNPVQIMEANIDFMGWKFVYENNANGSRIAGDKQQLIRAIRDGFSVKVMILSEGVGTIASIRSNSELFVVANEVEILSRDIGSERIESVFAKISIFRSEYTDYRGDLVTRLLKQNNNSTVSNVSLIVSTNGYYQTSELRDNIVISENTATNGMKWFVGY